MPRQTDLEVLHRGGTSSSSDGVAYAVTLRNRGAGTFWDVVVRVTHDGEETDRHVVARVGPESETDQVFLLVPARLCDKGTPGVGLRPLGHVTFEALIDGEAVAAGQPLGQTPEPLIDRVPRTAEEEATLLRARPDGWEYLLFAAVLLREMNALAPKYRDHEIGFAAPHQGPVLDARTVMDVLGGAMNEASALVANINRAFDASAQERAFGVLGQPGDPERIEHLASRVIAVYEGLLDWAARVRGLPVEDELTRLMDIVGHFVDLPIEQFREFVAHAVAEMDRLPALLAADEPASFQLSLTVEMDEALLGQHEAEMMRLRRLYGLD
jgi:hypothetical protein